MKIHTDIIQRSPEWFALRTGRITATSFTTMANGKTAGIETLCTNTAIERLTDESVEEPYTNEAMEHGIETEAAARQAYETNQLVHVQEVGFIERDSYIGCSPDGLVGDDGGIEIKCPTPARHLRYLIANKMPTKYRYQIQGALWITGRNFWDFVSYNAMFPPKAQLFIIRVLPDEKAFEALEKGAEKCIKKIEEITKAGAKWLKP